MQTFETWGWAEHHHSRWSAQRAAVQDTARAMAGDRQGHNISRLEQVTIRASVQSGKTALLIAAALYFMDMGKTVCSTSPATI